MGRFYSYLLMFQGSMVGIVLSDNILLLLVFWELTSLTSFLLIGYWSHLPESRQGARMALIVTGGGGLALIAGMLLLGQAAGSYELSEILQRGDEIRASPLYLPTLLAGSVGAFTKSAQFPFHFWLPHAMAAPTPVSAYLHSATMVKAGVFLMARLWPVLAGTDEWFLIVSLTGLVTMVIAAWIAIFKDDLKQLLAFSTVSHLGFMTMLLGMGTRTAAIAAVFHILNHATFKAPLFMSGRHRRSRGAYARHQAARRFAHPHADHRYARHHRERLHGGDSVAQRLPVQGVDARRGGAHRLCGQSLALPGHGDRSARCCPRPIRRGSSFTPFSASRATTIRIIRTIRPSACGCRWPSSCAGRRHRHSAEPVRAGDRGAHGERGRRRRTDRRLFQPLARVHAGACHEHARHHGRACLARRLSADQSLAADAAAPGGEAHLSRRRSIFACWPRGACSISRIRNRCRAMRASSCSR
jgi:hypothetical protein